MTPMFPADWIIEPSCVACALVEPLKCNDELNVFSTTYNNFLSFLFIGPADRGGGEEQYTTLICFQ
jgi:hypothetical protein